MKRITLALTITALFVALLAPTALAKKPEPPVQGPEFIEPYTSVDACTTPGFFYLDSFHDNGQQVYYIVTADLGSKKHEVLYFDGWISPYLTLANSYKRTLTVTIGMSEFGWRTYTYYKNLC